MSAVNIFTEPGRSLVFTDGATYAADGRLLALGDKCSVTAHLAITGRGNAWFPSALARAFEKMGWTIDDIAADRGTFIDECFESGKATMLKGSGRAFNDVFLVGWSKADDAPRIAQWSNCAPAGCARFSMVDSVMAPDLTDKGMERVREQIGRVIQSSTDFEAIGLAVMRAQRLDPGLAEFMAEGRFLVGGHIQRTDVTASGITKRIVHEWPEDRVGTRIRPAPDIDPQAHQNVQPLVGLSRAERRRLARQNPTSSASQVA